MKTAKFNRFRRFTSIPGSWHKLSACTKLALDALKTGVFRNVVQWKGTNDIVVHSAAFASKEDLQDGLLNCSAAGFAKATDISCHSFICIAKLACPLMKDGGTMFTMTYHEANKVIANYNVVGPVKAALECACRYLAPWNWVRRKCACIRSLQASSKAVPPPG